MRLISRSRLLLVVLASTLLFSACGPSQNPAGAAVIMGGRTISVDQIQDSIDTIVRTEPSANQLAQNHKLDLVSRALVSQLMVHDLLTHAAQQEGLVADPALIDQFFSENPLGIALPTNGEISPDVLAQQLAFRARDRREVYTDQVLLKQFGEKYLNTLSVTFDYTSVALDDPNAVSSSLRDKALEKAKMLAASPEAAVGIIEADKAAGIDASRGERIPAAQNPALAGSVLFGAPAGSVVAFQANNEKASWSVVVIRERSVGASEGVDQTQPADEGQLSAIGRRLLQPLVEKIGIRVNPRYGVWDPVSLQVAPNEAETQGIVLSVKETAKP